MKFTKFTTILLLISLSCLTTVRCEDEIIDEETPADGEPPQVVLSASDVAGDFLKGLNEKIVACTNQTGISIEQRTKIFDNDYSDDSYEVKCFIDCFWGKLGFMDENGKIIRDKFAESLNHVNIGRPSPIVNVDRILDTCLAIEKEDRCEFAHAFLKCYYYDDEFFKANAEIEAERLAADAANKAKDEL